jgi:hypothetical protein
MASGHGKAPHQQAGHMAAPTSRASSQKNPCQQGAVHTWHEADVQTAPMNVRFEGNNGHDADVARCLLMTHCGHHPTQAERTFDFNVPVLTQANARRGLELTALA